MADKTMCAFKILAQQLVKGSGRALPLQNFPRPSIEHPLYPLDLSAQQLRESRPFGEELAQ